MVGVQNATVGFDEDAFLVIRFPRRKGSDEVTVGVDYSTDLLTWSAAGPVLSFATAADPALELVTVRAPLPMSGGPRQFLRLRVETK